MVTLQERAKGFWDGRQEYPSFPHVAARRDIEANHMLPLLDGVHSVVDVGSGDGSLYRAMRVRCSQMPLWHAMDIGFMDVPPEKGTTFEHRDVFDGRPYPEADLTIASGVLNFAMSDRQARAFIESVRSPRLYVRTPCSIGRQSVSAFGYSKALGDDYVALYRTVEEVLWLLKRRFDVPVVSRIFSDEIESEFGTKHFIFEGVLR